jgi:hypothetical protein
MKYTFVIDQSMSGEMKMEPIEVKEMAAQGDVMFVRVDELPKTALAQERKGVVVVAHSETGHHHSVESPCAAYFTVPDDPFTAYLTCSEPVDVVHHRSFDTHRTVRLDAGTWMIRRQREYTPEGWRMVQD